MALACRSSVRLLWTSNSGVVPRRESFSQLRNSSTTKRFDITEPSSTSEWGRWELLASTMVAVVATGTMMSPSTTSNHSAHKQYFPMNTPLQFRGGGGPSAPPPTQTTEFSSVLVASPLLENEADHKKDTILDEDDVPPSLDVSLSLVSHCQHCLNSSCSLFKGLGSGCQGKAVQYGR